jgi:hypothetical protein
MAGSRLATCPPGQTVFRMQPQLALSARDRAKYLAIGESDRMTLRFIKPVAPVPAAAASMLLVLNKPYGVLCQFTDESGRRTLADFVHQKDVDAAGRLNQDSEGLLLTDNGRSRTGSPIPGASWPRPIWCRSKTCLTRPPCNACAPAWC